MKKNTLWLIKKSPLPILCFLAVLLLCLFLFEQKAKEIRNQNRIIHINRNSIIALEQSNLLVDEINEYTIVEDMPISNWFDEHQALSADKLRDQWKQLIENTSHSYSPEALLLGEARLLLIEERPETALNMLDQGIASQQGSTSIYLMKAMIEKDLGLYSDAVQSYERAILLSPRSFPAHFNLGLLFYQTQRYQLAEDQFQISLGLSSGLEKARSYRLLAINQRALGNFNDAEESLLESILLEPASIDARLELASLYMEDLNATQASLEVYEEIKRLAPQIPELYTGLAAWELQQNNAVSAMEILQDGLSYVNNRSPLILLQAKILLDSEKIEEAKSLLEQQGDDFPDQGSLLFQLSRVYYRSGQFSEAADALENSMEISGSQTPEMFNNMGLIYAAQEKWEQAEESYEQAISMDPYYSRALYNLGLLHLNIENLHEAKDFFQRVVNMDESHQAAWYNLGLVSRQLGQFQEALDAYDHAILLDPQDQKSRLNLAVLYRLMEQDSRAKEQYILLLQMNPNYASAWNNLAILQRNNQEYNQAEISFRRAIELAPEEEGYWLNLSALLAQEERHDEAIQLLELAIEDHSDSAVLRYNLGLQYKKTQQHQRATEQFAMATRLRPDYLSAWKHYADSLSDQGQHLESLQAYQEVIALDSQDDYSYYLAGKEAYSLEDFPLALEYFSHSLQSIADNAYIWYSTGKAHQAMGNSLEAQTCYSRALDINPELVEFIQNRLDQEEDTLQFFQGKIDEDPDNLLWHVQMALLLRDQELWLEAESFTRTSLDRFPEDADLLDVLIDSLYAQEKEDELIDLYNALIEDSPEISDYPLALAKIYIEKESWENAQAVLDAAQVSIPEQREITETLAVVYYQQESFALAETLYFNLSSRFPDDPSLILNLGKSQYRQALFTEAHQQFQRTVALEPDDNWAYIWLGRSLRKLHEMDQAEEQFLRAISLDENEDKAWIALGDLYREREDHERAFRAYSRAIELEPDRSSYQRRLESVASQEF